MKTAWHPPTLTSQIAPVVPANLSKSGIPATSALWCGKKSLFPHTGLVTAHLKTFPIFHRNLRHLSGGPEERYFNAFALSSPRLPVSLNKRRIIAFARAGFFVRL